MGEAVTASPISLSNRARACSLQEKPSLRLQPNYRRNRVLAAIPPDEWNAIADAFRPVPLERRRVLFEPDEPFTRLYFPISSVISSVAVFEDGSAAEMSITGREGMVGVSAILGSRTSLSRHIVQVNGEALEISYDHFTRIQTSLPNFGIALQAFAQAFVGQAGHIAACNSVHSVARRAARWLLMCHDRIDGDDFSITQEFLAEMLGVSRPSVGTVARALQRAGLIHYSRGHVLIKNRAGLEDTACECYHAINSHFQNRLFCLDATRN